MSRGGTPLGPKEVGCTDVIGSNSGFIFTFDVTRISEEDCLLVEISDDWIGLILASDRGEVVRVGVGTVTVSAIASSMHANR